MEEYIQLFDVLLATLKKFGLHEGHMKLYAQNAELQKCARFNCTFLFDYALCAVRIC